MATRHCGPGLGCCWLHCIIHGLWAGFAGPLSWRHRNPDVANGVVQRPVRWLQATRLSRRHQRSATSPTTCASIGLPKSKTGLDLSGGVLLASAPNQLIQGHLSDSQALQRAGSTEAFSKLRAGEHAFVAGRPKSTKSARHKLRFCGVALRSCASYAWMRQFTGNSEQWANLDGAEVAIVNQMPVRDCRKVQLEKSGFMAVGGRGYGSAGGFVSHFGVMAAKAARLICEPAISGSS